MIKDDNKFIVAEGNRRVMILKLLTEKINLPDYNDKIFGKNHYSNENSNADENEESYNLKTIKEKEKDKSNYEDCIKFIKQIKENYKDSIFEIYYLKIYTKYKKEVIVMAKILILFLLSAIALQGASMFLYLQYFRNNRLYKYI